MDILRISSVVLLTVAMASAVGTVSASEDIAKVETSAQFDYEPRTEEIQRHVEPGSTPQYVYTQRPERGYSQQQAMSPKVGRKFEPVLELFVEDSSEEQFHNAVAEMQEWDISAWNDYEKAMYWRYLGGIQATLNSFEDATVSYQQMLAYNSAISEATEKAALVNLAKFAAVLQNWEGANDYLGYAWDLGEEPTVDELQLRAAVSFQTGNFQRAVEDISAVISNREATDGMAYEANYNLQFASFLELDSIDNALLAANRRAEFYPNSRNCMAVEKLSQSVSVSVEPVEQCSELVIEDQS
ncbi:hypothetical protein [uncultured Umboniibacter sp.]|uniref:hypothetical protein n=1 Tax=uncultured Umboniibacter sp. TaxID=1798917 RepID=UPI00260E1048|nr:hypothetical protein [uncultured Umboniibacter sp.]